MSFGIDIRKLKRIIDLYQPNNQAQEMKYLLYLKGQDELYLNLQTCPFQGISVDSIEDRKAIFGINQFINIQKAITKPFFQSLTHPWIFIPLIMSFLVFLLEYFQIIQEEGYKTIVILIICIFNWLVQSAESFWFYVRSRRPIYEMENHYVTVIRENKKIEISPAQIVVGDIITLKKGDIIPADGWMIEGQDVEVIEPYTSGCLERIKNNFRQSLNRLKKSKEEVITTVKNELKCQVSPVLIGGSQIKKGELKMIILCVGSTSRLGELISHSHLNEQKNCFKTKLQKLVQSLYSMLVIIQIIFAVLICATIVYKASQTQWSYILKSDSWKNMLAIPYILIIGIPQGLHIGIMLGLWFLKSRLWFKHQIWVSYCEDILKMANVNRVCFDNSSEYNKVLYKEWWNERIHQLDRESLLTAKITETESNQLQLPSNIDQQFKNMFEAAYAFRDFKQPQEIYFPNDQFSLQKCVVEGWKVANELISGKSVNYIVQNGMIKYVLYMHRDNHKSSCFVLGKTEELLSHCSHKMSQQQGQINEFTTELIDQVKYATQSTKKKFMVSFIIAYIDLPQNQTNIEHQINAITKNNLTFLCLLGVNKLNDHNEYHLARNLKHLGIKMIVVTDSNLLQANSRARQAGLTTIQQKSIALSGDDFINLVGGVHCKECKKQICSCAQRKGCFTIKNKEELIKIEKALDVIGNASPLHKINLQIAMSSIENFTAYLGAIPEDKPALSKCYLSISTDPCVEDQASICFPKNSFKLLFELINWSRFSHQFVLKYIQLSFPALLVAVISLIIGTLQSHQLVFRLIPLIFTNVVLCPLLSLGLTCQSPSPFLMQIRQDNFSKNSKLITWSVKKQIIGQIIWQIVILFFVSFTGHLFIPEIEDGVDKIIGDDWAAKYSSSSKQYIANGLFANPLIDSTSYQYAYHHYHIYSRHLTIIYNIYAIMQIFNFINCRKITDKDINIMEGVQVQTIFIFILVFIIHIIFMIFASSSIGFYPQPLTLQQWLISIGFAMTVFFISFIVKLLPAENYSSSSYKRRMNKSAGLGVKLVAKRQILSDFQIEDDIQFKEQ